MVIGKGSGGSTVKLPGGGSIGSGGYKPPTTPTKGGGTGSTTIVPVTNPFTGQTTTGAINTGGGGGGGRGGSSGGGSSGGSSGSTTIVPVTNPFTGQTTTGAITPPAQTGNTLTSQLKSTPSTTSGNYISSYGSLNAQVQPTNMGGEYHQGTPQSIMPKFIGVKTDPALIVAYNKPDWRYQSGGTYTNAGTSMYGYTPAENLSPGQLAYAVDVAAGINPKYAGKPTDIKISYAASDISGNIQQSFQEGINSGQIAYSTEEEKVIVNKQAQQEFNTQFGEQSKFLSTAGYQGQGSFAIPTFKEQAIKYGIVGAEVGATIVAPELAGGYFLIKGLAKSELKTTNIMGKDILYPTEGASILGGVGGMYLGFGAESFKLTKGALEEAKWSVATPTYIRNEAGDVIAKVSASRTIASEEASQFAEYNIVMGKGGTADMFGTTESGQSILLKKGSEYFTGQTFGGTGKVTTTIVSDFLPVSKSTKPIFAGFKGWNIEGSGKFIKNVAGRGESLVFPEGTQIGAGSYYITNKATGMTKTYPFWSASKETTTEFGEQGIAVFGGKPIRTVFGSGEGKILGTIESKGLVFPTGFEESTLGLGRSGSVIESGGSSGGVLKQVVNNKIVSDIEQANLFTASKGISENVGSTALKEAVGVTQKQFMKTPRAFALASNQALIQTTKQDVSPAFDFGTMQLQETRTSAYTIPGMETAVKTREDTGYAFFQPQAFDTTQKQIQKSGYGFGTPSVPVFATSGFGFGYTPPPFAFPSMQFDEFGRGRKFKSRKIKYKYQPSFTALAFGITGKPIKFNVGGDEAYVPFRPIIASGRSKKQKKDNSVLGLFNMKRNKKLGFW
jgi:hypothetical protein